MQPEGSSYEDKIRADVVYFFDWISPLEEPMQRDYDFEGHLVFLDENDDPIAINMGMQGEPWHQAYCPPDTETPVDVLGCFGGHWYEYDSPAFPIWEDPDYVHFVFHDGDDNVIGDGYAYWSPYCPYWSLHRFSVGSEDVFIAIDFIDIPYPE